MCDMWCVRVYKYIRPLRGPITTFHLYLFIYLLNFASTVQYLSYGPWTRYVVHCIVILKLRMEYIIVLWYNIWRII